MKEQQRMAPVGVVLAGGASLRMGRDKAVLRLDGGPTLLEQAIVALDAAGLPDVAVAVSSSERAAALCDAIPAIARRPFVIDRSRRCGPLCGLHAALEAFPGRPVLLIACDMPHLDAYALRLLAGPWDADVVIPRPGGRDQPLHARYGPACRAVAARLLDEGKLAMRDLLASPELRVIVLDDDWLSRHNVAPSVFDNVNTIDDLDALTRRNTDVDGL